MIALHNYNIGGLNFNHHNIPASLSAYPQSIILTTTKLWYKITTVASLINIYD